MDEEYPEDEQPTGVKNTLIELIEFVAIIAAILVVIRFFIAVPHFVSGISMQPNFLDGDYIITNKLAVTFNQLDRGEVIVVENPRKAEQALIKRIIGLPGESIKISQGKVFINGSELIEPYLASDVITPPGPFIQENEEIITPKDHYFVIGDNREHSSDSREFGPVKLDEIIGQALLRYLPLNRLAIIKGGSAS